MYQLRQRNDQEELVIIGYGPAGAIHPARAVMMARQRAAESGQAVMVTTARGDPVALVTIGGRVVWLTQRWNA